MHNRCIGSVSRQKKQQPGHHPIRRMSVNGASTVFIFMSRVIYVPIGSRHRFIRYWQPLLGKATATCSLPHPENERQRCFNNFYLHILGKFMIRLVADIHLPDIGSLYWEKLQRHASGLSLRISVDGASTIVGFASWVIYVPIGWWHPFIRYWHPLVGTTTATCSLLHHENERQWSVNDFKLHILGNLFSNWLLTSMYEILTAFTGKNNSDMVSAASWKWESTERQQF